MALRYGDAVVSKPQAKLAGWFERRTSPFWQVKRWLELNGSILSYSHRQDAEVVWQCDLRECTVSAGSKACELILHRPGHDDFSIYALSLDELKLWFGEIKKVSDVRQSAVPSTSSTSWTCTAFNHSTRLPSVRACTTFIISQPRSVAALVA